MKYIDQEISKEGYITLHEVIEESDNDSRTGKNHARMIKPNEPIPAEYKEQIESDPNFEKYRTQKNADAYEAKLEAIKPSKKELPEQEKARKEKEKREQALERLIQKEMKAMEKEK